MVHRPHGDGEVVLDRLLQAAMQAAELPSTAHGAVLPEQPDRQIDVLVLPDGPPQDCLDGLRLQDFFDGVVARCQLGSEPGDTSVRHLEVVDVRPSVVEDARGHHGLEGAVRVVLETGNGFEHWGAPCLSRVRRLGEGL